MGSGTEIGRVRGLGSARHGAGHWLQQRTTALGNLALTIWLVASLLRLPDLSHGTVALWLASPLAAIPMLLLLASVIWHLRLGLTVFIEDYAHDQGNKLIFVILLNCYAIAAFMIGLYAIARLSLGAAA